MLAAQLRKYQNMQGVILAVPRGGVPVAYEVARELKVPLELILVKKLGHPSNDEYAIGAVGLKDCFVVPHAGVTDLYLSRKIESARNKLLEMKNKFMGGREPEALEGKTVIVIDDGIATGHTLLATVRILKKSNPARIILAVPVASRSAIQLFQTEVDELVALSIPDTFRGVSKYYNDFRPVEDEDIIYLLNKLNEMETTG